MVPRKKTRYISEKSDINRIEFDVAPLYNNEQRYNAMEVKFTRTSHEDHLFINVLPEGLLIGMTGGWTVGIAPGDAIGLEKNNKSSRGMIASIHGLHVLSHGDARLTLSDSEVAEMKSLISKAPWYR